jgi:branched-chain amino acid transport system ATP-binding protein
MNLLEVRNVTKRFGGLMALNSVSFELAEGAILGLIGPNGAGKTTLFNCVNGIYRPDMGRITFAGQDVTGKPPYALARLGVARAHQLVKPLNELSVLENVTAGACYGRDALPLGKARLRAAEVLAFAGLEQKSALLAGKLNVAEKKRLELARALAGAPRLLLLDEVLAGLNPSEVAETLSLVRAVRARGVSIFIIEHLMHAIMRVSDTVVVLDYGSVIAYGTPAAVAADPRVIEAYLGDPSLGSGLIEVKA